MKRMLPLMIAVFIVLIAVPGCSPKEKAEGAETTAKIDTPLGNPGGSEATAKSNNWKVTIVAASKYTEPRVNPNNPAEYLDPPVYGEGNQNLVLELRFEYVGPAGDVDAPALSVSNEKGETFKAIGNIQMSGDELSEFNAAGWLLSSTRPEPPQKHRLKGGEKFGAKTPITYYIADIPSASTDLKVLFADIPPIPIKPTQLK